MIFHHYVARFGLHKFEPEPGFYQTVLLDNKDIDLGWTNLVNAKFIFQKVSYLVLL